VVVVTVDAADVAHALAREGATVVIVAVAPEANARAGVLAREVEAAGGRVAVFTGDAGTDEGRAALTEMLDELFS
jgi:NAD(P)-dependent dehydrogenase (short-subunit alcohol dehydrogenase family)